MELKWIEDYLALMKHGSFSKAAEARFVTQPAFSRRIRSLENWLGLKLVDRGKYPTSFTEAGLAFHEQAEAIKKHIYSSREQMRGLVKQQETLVILSQHTLSVSFLPNWLKPINPLLENALLKVSAGNLHDSLESFLAGSGDFLLCFSSPDILKELEREDIESIPIGTDRLIPVTAINDNGEAFYTTHQDTSLRLLSYPRESFFGKLVMRECIPFIEENINYRLVCENALAEGLKAMVEKGLGIAWLPECLVEKELHEGRMKMLDILPPIVLQIRLYRFKTENSKLSNDFWTAAHLHHKKSN